ncbi:molybdopterin-binding/glycosyltransferase family 2 protein [Mesorhizobium sp. CAU 1741]|uniref:molybdopterin-binding/glycosyltransferase family 2 protein n=1 Tax=Mesorhizobium sp. CAU 1741 TaxID=3140366 RepID=UPI00325A5DAE
MKFGTVPLEAAQGAILAHAVSVQGRTWRKATVLSHEDIADMAAAGIAEVVVASLDAGDQDEDAAAERLAAALAAAGIEVRPAATGRVNLHAAAAGVLTVNRAAVDAINGIDPAITLATLAEFARIDAGQMLATVKIIPFGVDGALVQRAADIASASSVLAVHPFCARRVGLVQTVLPSIKPSVLDKTARLTAQRLERCGSMITSEMRTAHQAAEVAQAVADLARDNDMVIVFGASAVSDARDVIPAAIGLAGGSLIRVGMPVDPGNLLVIGRVGNADVIGAPGCARSPKLNGFDWVIERMLAGLDIGDREIAAMGVGGLLMEIETRPQPREPRPRRAVAVDAVLLAAGRGQRMGGPNKLLAEFDGKPLVRRMADTLAASKTRAVVAVVGHQGERIEAALGDASARIVANADYVSGLASSLKAGVAALPPDAAGALIVLGDMPGVTARDIDALIQAFIGARGNAIVRATHAGKRGNPVILPRALFDAVSRLSGDTGARHIVEGSDMEVIDVEIGPAASLDVDTPEAMARAGGVLAE